MATTWTGLYEMSPDHDAIISPVAGLDGLLDRRGASAATAPARPIVGKVLAELATGAPPTVDVTALRLGRFAEGGSLVETHVI